MQYAIRLGKTLMGRTYDDLDEARRDANGMLLSRSQDRHVEVVPLRPGMIGGVGEPILIGTRSRRGGPIKWTPGIDHK